MSGPNHPRGTSNTNSRGSAAQRRARKAWLLLTFDLDLGPERARCSFCQAEVTFDTITVDRFPVPGIEGGRYVRGNIRPACGSCNSLDGIALREARKACQEGKAPGFLAV